MIGKKVEPTLLSLVPLSLTPTNTSYSACDPLISLCYQNSTDLKWPQRLGYQPEVPLEDGRP